MAVANTIAPEELSGQKPRFRTFSDSLYARARGQFGFLSGV